MKKKKILIIALAQSSHTHAWIDLIDRKKFDVRLFGIKNSSPGVPIKAYYYCLQENFPFLNQMPSRAEWFNKARRFLFYVDYFNNYFFENWWLSRIIKNWNPDVVHTLGIDPAGLRFFDVLKKVKKLFTWIVTIRGGSDLELERFYPEQVSYFEKFFDLTDFVIADNKLTYQYAFELGLNKTKKPNWDFIPGTGGMDIDKLSKLRKKKAIESRTILWPKATEATYSKGLPVLEALKIAWPTIKPCRIVMTAVDADFRKWIERFVPDEIKESMEFYDRIPRTKLLKIMANSRVALLPSLIDGVPNSLYEAMATQTLPIISPLDTIKTVVGPENAIFARNLYPNEIAGALKKAMNEDKLVEKIISNNLPLVKKVADRQKIARDVNNFYEHLDKQEKC